MKTLEEQLTNYARYHRSSRNIATHLVGVPMIVLAITVLLSRPAVEAAGFPWSPAVAVAAVAIVYYLLLDRAFGLIMAAVLGACLWVGAWAAAQATAVWLAVGLGGFVLGWAIQFVGHHYEGRKPAFLDDVLQLMIGPLFVLAELLFMLGVRTGLQARIEQGAGSLRA